MLSFVISRLIIFSQFLWLLAKRFWQYLKLLLIKVNITRHIATPVILRFGGCPARQRKIADGKSKTGRNLTISGVCGPKFAKL